MNSPAPIPFDGEIDLGQTEWHQVTQDQIDLFAKATLDEDPMHVDPTWAAQNGPFGGTVAFGFQTMSLLTYFSHQIFNRWTERYPALRYALNYGFDRLRLVAPVPVGSKIRGRFSLVGVEPKGTGQLLRIAATIEIEGSERPAMTADWLFVAYPQAEAA